MPLYLVTKHDDRGDVLVGVISAESELLDLIVEQEREPFRKTIKCGCRGVGHIHDKEFTEHVNKTAHQYRMELAR